MFLHAFNMEGKEMIQNIFVGVLVAAAVAAGIWCWWVENGPALKKDEAEDAEEAECVNEKN